MAYPYIYSVSKPLAGSYTTTSMTYSYDDDGDYISLSRSTSTKYNKIIDGTTYTFNSNRYQNYNYNVNTFLTKKACIKFSGFGLTVKNDVYEMFKKSPIYFSTSTIDSESVYEVSNIITNVTFNTSDYYYEIVLDFNKLSDDIKTLISSSNSLRFYYAIGLTSSISTDYNITKSLTNFKTDNIPTTIAKNSSFDYTLEPLDDYYIKLLSCSLGVVSISDDKLKGTLSGTATDNITITGICEKIYEVEIPGKLTNCKCNFSNREIIDISKKNKITITADENCYFTGTYSYRQNYVTMNFDINEDCTVLTAPIYANCEYSLFDDYKASKQSQKISSFIHSYIMTDKLLTTLSKTRFYNDIDYGAYITSLYVLPLDITDYIGDSENIILGTYDTDIVTNTLTNYIIDFDFGTIDIKGQYENVYDYKNCNCYVNVPYFEEFTLNIDDIMDSTISIKATLDIYSSIMTLNIFSSKFNSNIYSSSRKIGFEIPYIQLSNGNTTNTYSNNNVNPITKAFIDIRYNTPYTKHNNIKEVIDYDVISNHVNEFIKCDNVFITENIKNEDIDNIVDLLKEGVFINE